MLTWPPACHLHRVPPQPTMTSDVPLSLGCPGSPVYIQALDHPTPWAPSSAKNGFSHSFLVPHFYSQARQRRDFQCSEQEKVLVLEVIRGPTCSTALEGKVDICP